MKRSSIIWIVVLIVAIVVVAGIWYWSSSRGAQNTANENTSSTAAANSGGNTGGTPPAPAVTATTSMVIVLNTESNNTLGNYLSATNGMTLYKYASDKAGVSNCTGACATAWPPYTISAAEAKALLGGTPGVTGKVGVITRSNGTMQVTYNGMPLYFYEKDSVVGDTLGQNVGGFAVVNP
jgi:predicted lipoprotein with Yx(FWY)xxD motif